MGKKTGEFKQVGFRMPSEHYDLLSQVAEARGIDLSALLNNIIAGLLPDLKAWLTTHKQKMSAASPIEVSEQLLTTLANSPHALASFAEALEAAALSQPDRAPALWELRGRILKLLYPRKPDEGDTNVEGQQGEKP